MFFYVCLNIPVTDDDRQKIQDAKATFEAADCELRDM